MKYMIDKVRHGFHVCYMHVYNDFIYTHINQDG